MESDGEYLSALKLANCLGFMEVYSTTLSEFIFVITIMDSDDESRTRQELSGVTE